MLKCLSKVFLTKLVLEACPNTAYITVEAAYKDKASELYFTVDFRSIDY